MGVDAFDWQFSLSCVSVGLLCNIWIHLTWIPLILITFVPPTMNCIKVLGVESHVIQSDSAECSRIKWWCEKVYESESRCPCANFGNVKSALFNYQRTLNLTNKTLRCWLFCDCNLTSATWVEFVVSANIVLPPSKQILPTDIDQVIVNCSPALCFSIMMAACDNPGRLRFMPKKLVW